LGWAVAAVLTQLLVRRHATSAVGTKLRILISFEPIIILAIHVIIATVDITGLFIFLSF
jgi:hypothetical protein